ncbi:MAG TPA: hypothetical protein EYG74_03525 [Sulfurimonas autotrophica]|nr:hypothetical protein [Sulfurimonas autotrophica]
MKYNFKYICTKISILVLLSSISFAQEKTIPIFVGNVGVIIPAKVVKVAYLWTDNHTYEDGESILVHYTQIFEDPDSWIGIFYTGDTKNSYNIIQDLPTNGDSDGQMLFYGLPVGNYDLVFYGLTLEPQHILDTTRIRVQ